MPGQSSEDAPTGEGPGRPRGARHFLTGTGSGYFARVIAIVVGIATLPIGIAAYGTAIYGVWITAASLTQYFSTGSLGMPLAVMTATASAPDRQGAARIGAHGLRVALAGSLGLLSVGVAAVLLIPKLAEGILGAEGTIPHVLAGVIVLVVGSAALQPLQIYAAVLAGRHRIVAGNAYEATRNIGRLGALLGATTISDSLLVLAIATVAVEGAVALVRALHVTIAERVPIHRHVLDRSARHDGLVGSGMRFFALCRSRAPSSITLTTSSLALSSVLQVSRSTQLRFVS